MTVESDILAPPADVRAVRDRLADLSSLVHASGRILEAVRSALRNFCRGSLEELLTGMVDHRVVDSSELRRLAEKIVTLEKSKGRKKS